MFPSSLCSFLPLAILFTHNNDCKNGNVYFIIGWHTFPIHLQVNIYSLMTCNSEGNHKAKERATLQYFLKEQRQSKSKDLFTTVLALTTLHKQPFSKDIYGKPCILGSSSILEPCWLVPALVKLQATMVRKASLLKMERLKHACFMHPNPESFMHEISSNNIE